MNPYLAKLYGTGHVKTASEGGDHDELDLDSMSAAELLAGLQSGEIVLDGDQDPEPEKTAGEDEEFDFSQLSARDLLEIWAAEEEEQEKTAGARILDAMAQDGSLDYFDTAGRIVAHAMNDELRKVASFGGEDDEIVVDLDQLSAEDLVELMDQGYEFVDDEGEKTASFVQRAGKAIGNAFSARKFRSGRSMVDKARALGEKATKAKGLADNKMMSNKSRGVAGRKASAWTEMSAKHTERGKKLMRRGALETGAAYGGTGLAALGGGAAIYGAGKRRGRRG